MNQSLTGRFNFTRIAYLPFKQCTPSGHIARLLLQPRLLIR